MPCFNELSAQTTQAFDVLLFINSTQLALKLKLLLQG
jgi:hypothetical protein